MTPAGPATELDPQPSATPLREPRTLPQFLLHRAAEWGDRRTALREKDFGIWQSISWRAYLDNVRRLSLGLTALGLVRGDKVAIIGDNRPEWFYAELAAQAAGAASVGLFQDAVAHELQFIVDHSDARFVVVEDQEQIDKLLEVKDQLPQVEKIIYYDPKGLRHYNQPFLLSMEAVQGLGDDYERAHPGAFEAAVAQQQGHDLAVICYTSGTTGSPKGAMLSHDNLVTAVRNLTNIDPLQPGDDYVSFLPCGWIVEQVFGVAAALVEGFTVNFPEEPETVQQNIREIGPQMMLAAPRIWENLVSEVVVKMQDAAWLNRKVYDWALRVGYAVVDLESTHQPVPPGLRLQHALADRLILAPLRDHLGLRRLRRAYTGGAALGPDALRFFRAIGANLKQVYGQTEIAGLSVIHRDGDVDPESVGQPIENTEVRISDQGEIISRSSCLFVGYYKNPEATASTVRDGWLYTGDAGIIDEKGHLVVIDRMKDVMVLADGTRFAPQYVENKLKFSPYIREAVAVGPDRPFVGALINIDLGNVGRWAENNQIAYTTFADLAQKSRVYQLIAADVERVNRSLPLGARIKRFILLHKELDADDDEVTRTRKLRRGVIGERYAEIIEALYAPGNTIEIDSEVHYQDGRTAHIQARLQVWTMAESPGERAA
jgi:long-chain acyl-CoA synthetase